VIRGEIEAQVGSEKRRIGEGGFFRVPSNTLHGIQILTPTVQLIDVFTPPREDFRR
jgi:quercetin dioxygenase-like cupin family protein